MSLIHQNRLTTFLCLIFLALTFSLASTAGAAIRTVTGTVTKVADGDTIQVTTPEGTKLRVRLYGIDAPETDKVNQKTGRVSKPGQPYGEESRKALDDKIFRQRVKLEILDIDRYQRMVAIVWLGSRNINLEMIEEGHAEAYLEYLKAEPYKSQFIKAQRKAVSANRGMWGRTGIERPSEFRKRMRIRGE